MKQVQEKNVEALELCWKDLKVTSNDGTKTLLHGLSGKIQGSFMAVFMCWRSLLCRVLLCYMMLFHASCFTTHFPCHLIHFMVILLHML